MASNTKKVPVRILSEITVGRATYKPNQVVVFDSRTATRLVKEGMVDNDEDAVEYCLSQGSKPVEHCDVEAEDVDVVAGGEPPAQGQ